MTFKTSHLDAILYIQKSTRNAYIQEPNPKSIYNKSQLGLPILYRRPARCIQLLILSPIQPVQLVAIRVARIPSFLDQVAFGLFEGGIGCDPRHIRLII